MQNGLKKTLTCTYFKGCMTIYVHLMTVCVGVCLPREHIRFRAQLAVWACEAKRKWVGSTTLSTTTFPVHAKDEIFFFFFTISELQHKHKREARISKGKQLAPSLFVSGPNSLEKSIPKRSFGMEN